MKTRIIIGLLIASFSCYGGIFTRTKVTAQKFSPGVLVLAWTNFPLIGLDSANYSTGLESSTDGKMWTECFRADYNYGEWQVMLPMDKPVLFFRAFNGPKLATPEKSAWKESKGVWSNGTKVKKASKAHKAAAKRPAIIQPPEAP
jgi:hypothetical protein